jgi:hypothetical protein
MHGFKNCVRPDLHTGIDKDVGRIVFDNRVYPLFVQWIKGLLTMIKSKGQGTGRHHTPAFDKISAIHCHRLPPK